MTPDTTTQRSRQRSRSVYGLALAASLACLSLLLSAAPALAVTVTDRPLIKEFNGADTTAGAFSDPRALAIDQSNGTVYVIDGGTEPERVLDRFNYEGAAQPFSATGSSSLPIPGTEVAVDNSGVNPGRIYLVDYKLLQALEPGGATLCEAFSSNPYFSAATVDPAGRLWVGDNSGDSVLEFAGSGCPPKFPSQIGSFPLPYQVMSLSADANGNLYIIGIQGSESVDKYTSAGVKVETLDPAQSRSVTVDQSSASGHVFTLHDESFNEYEAAGTQVGAWAGNVVRAGGAIAYLKELGGVKVDRVYVAEEGPNTVKVFGPAVTGTVPDATIEAVSEVGFDHATASGRVNPQGVPNSYFFEWKLHEYRWGGAERSSPQSLPEDSTEHPVSLKITGLRSNSAYDVRLVTENTAKHLRAVSAAETFTTLKPPAPTFASCPLTSAITTGSAHVECTIDPYTVQTTWQVEKSAGPSCATGAFSAEPQQTIAAGAPGSVTVAYDLTGLLPHQHYCVRIEASNGGASTSNVAEFDTETAPPDEAETAFAAPLVDTSARVNARVNPEGAPFSYQFEYSEDGGASWKSGPVQSDSSDAREQIVVGEELENLAPDTTYSYRLASASNGKGSATILGGTRSFTTRPAPSVPQPPDCPNEGVRRDQHTTYLPDCRGTELVNNPDKGNQNAEAFSAQARPPGSEEFLFQRPVSADGERALWQVLGGAPGAPNPSGSAFRAERTAGGWQSHAIVPPVDQQYGGGKLVVAVNYFTPDLSRFAAVFSNLPELALARFQGAGQQLLGTYPNTGLDDAGIELTDDAAHVITINEESGQLEDFGSGVPQVLSLMPDGTQSSCGLTADVSFRHAGIRGQGRSDYRWIAATDAARVYFQARLNGSACGGPYGIYVRDREAAKTTLIDLGAAGQSPEFIRATPDGRSAYYVTYSKCRRFSQASPFACEAEETHDANSGADVYRWDEASGESTCLTCVVADADIPAGQRISPIMVSDDFSHIYFVSQGQLVTGRGRAGDYNLYVLSGGTVRFVADPNDILVLQDGSAQLSADGNVLVFFAKPSHRLTADRVTPGADTELYRYDDRAGSLECVSCLRGGVTSHPTATASLSSDGSTVAFATAQALLPSDVNQTTDVYDSRDGRIALITNGVSDFPDGNYVKPEVMAVDADGGNIFFRVDEPGLTGFERDGFANLYDARVGGGFAPPTPPARCDEESCQGPLPASPALAFPASATFSGPGNVAAQPAATPKTKTRPKACRRGRARKRARGKLRCAARKHGKARKGARRGR